MALFFFQINYYHKRRAISYSSLLFSTLPNCYEKFNGVVENVDMAKKDVVVQYHKDKMSFSVGDKTKLFEGGKELKLSDLNKGLWASVEYQKEGNQLLAKSIHVNPVKHAKNTASSKRMTEKKMMPSEKTTENK